MTDFVLLGAGFSRAISDVMPLLPDLGQQVLSELAEGPATLRPFDNNLEQWLSFLSTDQPWLGESANLRNRAQFRDASSAVQRCIERAEARAPYPQAWLERLIHEWCASEAIVASFNYDLLLERTTSAIGCVSTWLDLYGPSLEVRHAPARGLSAGYPSRPGPAYRLLKLHGSVNWAYGGLDAPASERIVLTREDHWWDEGAASTEARSAAPDQPRFDDLEPLIVPPTGTKGPYYGNRSLRGQWRRAFEGVAAADTVTIIGYSFPPSDLVSRHFFASADLTCSIVVVDRREQAAEIVQALAPNASVRAYTGMAAVEDFVDATCGDFVRWTTAQAEPEWRTKPRLVVNGREENLNPAPDDYDPLLSGEHQNSATGWLNGEVIRRFPRLETARRYSFRRPDPEAPNWVGSYHH